MAVKAGAPSAKAQERDMPENIRLPQDLRQRIAAHHVRTNKRLKAETGVTVSRAEVIRALIRAGLDLAERGAEREG